ncbi:MAG: molybdate ABC transporter substrate-binding protein [Azoarcus sp.]|jgi:molybdate transport system substrate-binding protein|nr:molybdate ABC transporter substrate-binding protein [Azoarcus sp.]MDX9838609.1 molybdate ABC transporter substrate-binding protein [Azoarcus sp.]
MTVPLNFNGFIRRRFRAVCPVFLIPVMLVLAGFQPAYGAEMLTIAAGAGYRRPITELAAAFERTSGIRVASFFGNMGQVFAQAGQSDQVAVVFGDQAFLQRADTVRFGRMLDAGRGRLVLAWPKGRRLNRVEDIDAADVGRIAMPDARHAIYGKAAAEFLEHSGLIGKVADRLLTVATVPQVSAYLVSGEVDAGFINLTDALGVKERIGGFIEIDPSLYGEIRIVGGVVEGREALPGVSAFGVFLDTAEARAILGRHGL